MGDVTVEENVYELDENPEVLRDTEDPLETGVDVEDDDDETIPDIPYIEYQPASADVEFYFTKPHNIRCLGEIPLSRSSLLTNPFYLFQPITDPGVEGCLWQVETKYEYDNIGVQRYQDLCKKYETPVIREVIKELPTECIDLKYYGLATMGVRALVETLQYNFHVKILDLTNNWLTSKAVEYISEMLLENGTLTKLILRECRIGPDGAKALGPGIANNVGLTELDLGSNSITDEGMNYLSPCLAKNILLEELDLSHNYLNTGCCEQLGDALMSMNLKKLNLSWNTLCDLKGMKPLMEGIRENYKQSCTHLTMQWNSLCGMGSMGPLSALLKKHTNMEFLDISFNLIAGEPLAYLKTGIQGCQPLKELRIGSNPLSQEDILSLTHMLASSPKSQALMILDLTDMYISKENIPHVERIARRKRIVRFRSIIGNYEIIGPDYQNLLLERCKFLLENSSKKKGKASKKKTKEFGTWLYEFPRATMKKWEFLQFIASINCKKLTGDGPLLAELIQAFSNEKKEVLTGEMLKKYLTMYPNTEKPQPKPNPPTPPGEEEMLPS